MSRSGANGRLPAPERRAIVVQGIVQGVGFRPFVYGLAARHGLTGWVRNDGDGVTIEAQGSRAELEAFIRGLDDEAPPLALVEHVSWRRVAALAEQGFRIEASRGTARRDTLIPPDVALCDACLRELFDPGDRRYRYPFINCTRCGPRFTIIREIPYDRATTTMAGFTMCGECAREYEDPADRRYHAQPNACAVCGPCVSLLDGRGAEIATADPIREAAARLRAGEIVAVKGLGGYHLACNPFDGRAVAKLRERKSRQEKPFALMVPALEHAASLCRLEVEEMLTIGSPDRPIVVMQRRPDCGVAEAVAPRQKTLGVMLAYTPLHHILLRDAGIPLVMTSGNRSDEPIAYKDPQAVTQLSGIADCFLTHNRPIHMRCDDSVYRLVDESLYPLRRSRGRAPAPLTSLHPARRQILACGGGMKNTFCIVKERHIFLSHHIGDLDNYETMRSFEEGIDHFCRLFELRPEVVACDMHPDYLSTLYARDREEEGLPLVAIQHHAAHIASCLADNHAPEEEQVIGVALDGTGYGTDGAIWGGEILTGSLQEGFTRRAHLQYLPLPGGEAAIHQPWRAAVAQLVRLYGEEGTFRLGLGLIARVGERDVRNIGRQMAEQINTPQTSSAGRLFDIVAALIGVPGSGQITYEGQAAIELELAAAGPAESGYPFDTTLDGECRVVGTDAIIAGVVDDLRRGRPASEISSRFHRTIAEIVVAQCKLLRSEIARPGRAKPAVALSGGTFQNMLLMEQLLALLGKQRLRVYRHQCVPPNDGGLCLGQAALASCRIDAQ